jgi:hypothetical protein
LIASIFDSVLKGGSDALFDAIGGIVLTLFSVFVIPRQLWRLRGAHRLERLKIFVSARNPELTRTYALPVVGLGQLQAIAAIAASLVRAYGWRWRDPLPVRAGDDTVTASDLAGNIVALGGASKNAVTRRLLKRRGDALGLRQEHRDSELAGDRIFLRRRDGSWRPYGGMAVTDGVQDVAEDYAVIVRLPNPWVESRGRQCLVFAGVYTFGTGAAARYFVRQWWKPMWWWPPGVVAVLRLEIEDGQVIQIERVAFRWLPIRRGNHRSAQNN